MTGLLRDAGNELALPAGLTYTVWKVTLRTRGDYTELKRME